MGDFDDLFRPGAPWAQAASRVSVFKLATSYVLSAPDPELRAVIAWVQQHRMALAMEGPLLNPPQDGDCGHVESYGAPRTLAAAEKIRRLGGRLDILTAQEALWFGHFYNGRSACHSPVPELVANEVVNARQLRTIFPAIRIVDIEPISNFRDPDWVNAIGQWLEAFRQQSGEPYAGVEIDIAWWQPGWQERARAIASYLRSIRMPIGVIYNGNAREQLGFNWVLQAEQHWREYERVAGVPDDAVFQSWTPQPSRLLPETAPDAFTSALIDYERFHQ